MLYVALGAEAVLILGAFLSETRMRPRGRLSKVQNAVAWSVVWLALGLLPTLTFGLFQGTTPPAPMRPFI